MNLKRRYALTWIAVALCFLTALTSFLILLHFERIVDEKISESVKLQNESATFKSWKSKSSASKFIAYFYNLTNPYQVLAGDRPNLNVVGPYVYWQEDEKLNISWTTIDDLPAISYYKRSTYKFDPELSVGNPKSDRIISANLPILALSAASNAGRGPGATTIELIKFLTSPEIFTTQSVNGFLWGYVDSTMSLCNTFYPQTCPSDRIGLLINSNNTVKGPFIIDAGIKNASNTGNFFSITGKRSLSIWSTERANEIHGTDGSRLAYGIKLSDPREVFATLLCQPIKLTAKNISRPKTFDQLEVMEMDLVTNTRTAEETYCPVRASGPACPPKGFFDISQCAVTGDVSPPVFASLPYFFDFSKNITGGPKSVHNNDQIRNEFRLLAEPKTGIVVEAHLRLQINAHIQRSAHMTDLYRNISDPMYLPIAWFENDIEGGEEELRALYESIYIRPARIRLALLVCLISSVTITLLLLIEFAILMKFLKVRRTCCNIWPHKQNPSVKHLLLDPCADSASDLFLKNNDTVRSAISPWSYLIDNESDKQDGAESCPE
ncbi:hypothetical protein Aperf_G00000047243 [Anoplocephala perfoliata]